MGKDELFEKLSEAIVNCDTDVAKEVARKILETNIEPIEAIEKSLAPAIRTVGDRFEKGEYFLTHLMLAAEGVKAATEILTASMSEKSKETLRRERERAKRIVLGTVKGDIHDIGKNIVSLLLQVNGFNVYDLGKDVSSRGFVEKAEEVKAHIVGLSALMTVTQPYQAEVVNLLKEMGLREKYRVIVGGGPTSASWAEEIGADGWAPDASEAVTLVKRLLT